MRRGDRVIGVTSVFRDVSDRVRAERRTDAEHAATRVLAAGSSVEEVAPALVRQVCEALQWKIGALWLVGSGKLHLEAYWSPRTETVEAIKAAGGDEITFARGEGLAGTVWAERAPQWVLDIAEDPRFAQSGFRDGCTPRSPSR